MPDPVAPKRVPIVAERVDIVAGYAELHCRTNFTFLEGASHGDELVASAAQHGYRALAVTDQNSLAGVVRAHVAAKEAGLKLLVGAEIVPVDAPAVLVWASDRRAYGRLARMLTVGRRAAPKGECRLTFADVAEYSAGLLAGVPLKTTTVEAVRRYRAVFGERCYGVAELHRGPRDRQLLQAMMRTAREARVPLVAANDVHYHVRERRPLQDVLAAIRHGCSVAELGARMFPNGERYLKSCAEMKELFADCPEAVPRTLEVAARCTFSLDELRYEYPEELAQPGMSPLEHLTRLTWQGAQDRYPDGIPDKVRRLLEHELVLIAELHYEAYFLTVWDLVRFARGRDILCQGRGSAANSAVCYCLGVTSVDPERIDVLFERFVSKERDEAPDIDIDFEHERREEVLQYVYDKYGRERAGMTAEVITYQMRSAVRDVGKALGLSQDRIDVLAKTMDHHHDHDRMVRRLREAGFPPDAPLSQQLIALVGDLVGFPRHLSQHVGGMVITHGPLCELVPIENAAMADRTVVQWDKNDLDALGILKVDCLALGMLTAIRKCFAIVAQRVESETGIHHASVSTPRPRTRGRGDGGEGDGIQREEGAQCQASDAMESSDAGCSSPSPPSPLPPSTEGEGCSRPLASPPPSTVHRPPFTTLTLASVPAEDPAVYEMISRADTIGVFQIESRAQMSMLPRLRPRCFYDLVIEVAIVRPGPIQGDMVHPYLRRRTGKEAVEYPSEAVRTVLEKTLGVPLFQEQAMRLAVVAGGFTPGEADQLRRAMGAWRKRGVMEQFRQKLVSGMLANGYTQDFADRLFHQIQGFGEYGFPESHAASFALLVYVSAWLKCYYPAAFAAALINSQPMGFYAPAQLLADAKKHGVQVLPIDVNDSAWDCEVVESEEWRVKSESHASMIAPRPRTRGRGDGGEGDRIPCEESSTCKASDASSLIGIGCSPPPPPSPLPPNTEGEGCPRLHASESSPSTAHRPPSTTSLRLGLRLIRGLSERDARRIEGVRRPFASFDDFVRQTGLGRGTLKRLAQADAFRSLKLDRRKALWQALPDDTPMPLFDALDRDDPPDALPTMPPLQEVLADYGAAGVTLRQHPMAFLRTMLDAQEVVAAARLATTDHGRWLKVAGVVLLRQRPGTANGITFVTLEDETGMVNLIVRKEVWERCRRAARTASVMLVHGRLQKADGVIHVLAAKIEDLSAAFAHLNVQPRNFR